MIFFLLFSWLAFCLEHCLKHLWGQLFLFLGPSCSSSTEHKISQSAFQKCFPFGKVNLIWVLHLIWQAQQCIKHWVPLNVITVNVICPLLWSFVIGCASITVYNYKQLISYCHRSVNMINYSLVKSDHIKWRLLKKNNMICFSRFKFCISLKPNWIQTSFIACRNDNCLLWCIDQVFISFLSQ